MDFSVLPINNFLFGASLLLSTSIELLPSKFVRYLLSIVFHVNPFTPNAASKQHSIKFDIFINHLKFIYTSRLK